MAHELNNPASAVARNASALGAALGQLEQATRAFCALGLSDGQCTQVEALRATVANEARAETRTAIEKADRQDAIADWLDAKHVTGIEADRLVDAGWTPPRLDELVHLIGVTHAGVTLTHLAAEQSARQLTRDIERAASRIHDLVSAVKRYTYMDQAQVTAPTALAQGLADTVTMLGSKARENDIEVRLDVDPALPMVDAIGGELNQVWTNLLDNALDALPRGGRVVMSARAEDQSVVVRVADNGPGIPPEIRARVFDPFFTTKGVGHGTGLGLDIARRLVLRHRGTIDFTTGNTGTTFAVSLPVSAQGRPS
jgi:signal transduction histidine kinase